MTDANNYQIEIERSVKSLTKKQFDILSCLLFGLSYKEIGRLFNISNRTVEGHIREIALKTGLKNKKEIILNLSMLQGQRLYNQLKDRFSVLVSRESIAASSLDNAHFFRCDKTKCIFGTLIVVIIICLLSFYKSRSNFPIRNIGTNSYLLERRGIIEQIKPTLFKKNNIVALVGQGGAGKTTIARKYLSSCGYDLAYEINAETFDSLFNGLSGFACLLAQTTQQKENLNFIRSIENKQEQIKQTSIFIHNILKELDSWCVLLDNAEDLELLKYVYQSSLEAIDNGQIIITTRNSSIGNYFPCNVITIGELTQQEKIKLFEIITVRKANPFVKKSMVEIPSYPLDVATSAHYIKNTDITLDEYVKKMKNSNCDFWNSSRRIFMDNTSYANTRESIVFSILERITKINVKFKKPLFALSLMDSQNIPVKFLKEMCDDNLVRDLLYHLKKYGLVTVTENYMSMHRSVQILAFNFFKKNFSKKEERLFWESIVSKLIPYEKIITYDRCNELIPHLKRLVDHLATFDLDEIRIMLLVSLGKLLKEKGISAFESVEYFNLALELNKNLKVLDVYEEACVYLDAGEACVISNKNKRALNYLNKSFVSLNFLHEKYAEDCAKNYNLLGIVNMRSNKFNEANNDFDNALNILKNITNPSFAARLVMAKSYVNKGSNYILYYINKSEIERAIFMMEKAISIIDGTKDVDGIKVLANTKARVAGIYNATKRYKIALTKVIEAEKLLNTIQSKDNYYFCTLGLILMEKGHATLRLNKLEEARSIFKKAKELFDKTMIGDHSLRLRMQEAEVLIRLGHLDDAYKNCLEVFEKENIERNDYNELFFNTAHYNAGVVKYRQKDLQKSLKHFNDFAIGMKSFCEHFLTKDRYDYLKKEGAFEVVPDAKEIKKCFENSFKIFSVVCVVGSEFVSDYVQKNYEDIN